MPEISRFFGIIIRMYFGDHLPPHFHAAYDEHQAIISIEALTIIGGHLPPRALGLVVEWASQHRDELLDLWRLAASYMPLHKLPPLD
mgnify:CR=1 FL=1